VTFTLGAAPLSGDLGECMACPNKKMRCVSKIDRWCDRHLLPRGICMGLLTCKTIKETVLTLLVLQSSACQALVPIFGIVRATASRLMPTAASNVSKCKPPHRQTPCGIDQFGELALRTEVHDHVPHSRALINRDVAATNSSSQEAYNMVQLLHLKLHRCTDKQLQRCLH
jgi:hypothetical protein